MRASALITLFAVWLSRGILSPGLTSVVSIHCFDVLVHRMAPSSP
jgi:hypothetical protein